jgi:hypothetical protein
VAGLRHHKATSLAVRKRSRLFILCAHLTFNKLHELRHKTYIARRQVPRCVRPCYGTGLQIAPRFMTYHANKMVTKALHEVVASSSSTSSAPNKLINEKVDEAIAAGVSAANSNFKTELDKWHQRQSSNAVASSASSLSEWEEDLNEWNIKLKDWVDTATAEARANVKMLPEKSQRALAGGLLLIALSALEDLVRELMRGLRATFDKTLDAAEDLWRRLRSVYSTLKEAVMFATLAILRKVPGYKPAQPASAATTDPGLLQPLLAEQV